MIYLVNHFEESAMPEGMYQLNNVSIDQLDRTQLGFAYFDVVGDEEMHAIRRQCRRFNLIPVAEIKLGDWHMQVGDGLLVLGEWGKPHKMIVRTR